jgi:type IV pilus assembly protein PilP
MNMNKLLLSMLIVTGLTACADSSHDDIQTWMKDQEKTLTGKIETLPEAKTFTPVPFSATNDPFVVKEKINLSSLLRDKYAPDMKREKEALEFEPLESLKMTGTVIKDGKIFAMIKNNQNVLSYVTKGNHMGINHGEITYISEGEMVIEERVQVNEEWNIKPTRIYLYEGGSKK